MPLQAIPLQVMPLQAIPLQVMPLQAIPLQVRPLQAIPLQVRPLQASHSKMFSSIASKICVFHIAACIQSRIQQVFKNTKQMHLSH